MCFYTNLDIVYNVYFNCMGYQYFFQNNNFKPIKFIIKGAKASYYEQTNRIHRMRKHGYRYDRWDD